MTPETRGLTAILSLNTPQYVTPKGGWVMATAEVRVGSRDTEEYVLRVIAEIRHGAERVVITGYGDNICKVADVYNMLRERLGESLELVEGDIKSIRVNRRRRPSLTIIIEYKGPA